MFLIRQTKLRAFVMMMFVSAPAAADLTAQKAQRMFFSLAAYRLSTAPKNIQDQMMALVAQGRFREAAAVATAQRSFFEDTIRHWAMKKTNGEQTPYGNLNDFVATVIGHTRDNGDFRELFYGDFTYFAAPNIPRITTNTPAQGVRAHSSENQLHYLDLQARDNLFQELVRAARQYPNGVRFRENVAFENAPSAETAGVLTSYAFMKSSGFGGTNRRFIKYILEIFLKTSLDEMGDAFALDHRVRRDVDRFPGGDMNLYNSRCRFCHAGMDALAGAFAKWDFERDRVAFQTNGGIQGKYNQNITVFSDGYQTVDSSWENLWLGGNIKWDPGQPLSGIGARDFGRMIAYSDRLPVATAISVFEYLCKRIPSTEGSDLRELETSVQDFEKSNFNLRVLFESVASLISCTGM